MKFRKLFKPIVLLCDDKRNSECMKPGARKRRDAAAGKRSYYCYECLRKFGAKSKQVRKIKVPKCPDCGVDLRHAKSMKARAGVVTRLKINRGLRRAKRTKGGYDVYLRSPLWRRIRKRILERDGYLCRECGVAAEHVHHLSYGPLVMMGMDDSKLISLCVPCHDSRHPDKPSMVRK